MKKLLAVALVVVMVLSLAACGGADYVGSWTIDEDALKETVLDMVKDQLGADIDLDNEIYASVIDSQIEGLAGYELEVTSKEITMSLDDEKTTKEYEKTDNGFKLVEGGQTINFTYDSDDDTLSFSYNSMELTFKRK